MQIKFKKFFYRHKMLTIISILLVLVCLFYLTLNLTTYINVSLSSNVNSNNFSSQSSLVYVQKNQNEHMDNTIMHYKNILESNNKYAVDGFEINVFLTKDNKIVVSTMDKLDDFSDCTKPPFNEKNVYIGNKSIGELKQYNIAYNIAINGIYPYRSDNADLTNARIITLDELLNYLKVQNNLWKKQFKLIINIEAKRAEATILALENLLQVYYYTDYSVVVTNSNSMAKMVDEQTDLKRTATKSEVVSFFYNTAFNIKNTNIKYDLIYIEKFQCGINFGKTRYVSYAHYCGVPIIYRNAHTANKINLYAKLSPDGIASTLPEETYLAIK